MLGVEGGIVSLPLPAWCVYLLLPLEGSVRIASKLLFLGKVDRKIFLHLICHLAPLKM